MSSIAAGVSYGAKGLKRSLSEPSASRSIIDSVHFYIVHLYSCVNMRINHDAAAIQYYYVT